MARIRLATYSSNILLNATSCYAAEGTIMSALDLDGLPQWTTGKAISTEAETCFRSPDFRTPAGARTKMDLKQQPDTNPHNGNDDAAGIVNTDVVDAAKDVAMEVVDGTASTNVPKKKRLCRYPGCKRVIKSQGHCQRHGAKAKRCKIAGCDKQAQGTHDGMCKRHWKALNFPEAPPKAESQPPPPQGESVYDGVLPQSISYRPGAVGARASTSKGGDSNKADSMDSPAAPDGACLMPLVAFLREGAQREVGWHRQAERRARGVYPVASLSNQLEPWERQLALVEILLLSGGTPYANFKDLAHAWGREKGFHHVLANSVCERRGEVERKRRSDAGRTLSAEEKQALRLKVKKTRGPRASEGKPKTENATPAPKPEVQEAGMSAPGSDAVVGETEAAEDDQPNMQEV